MSERDKKPDEDPTADFLSGVRPEETPWRTDRPPEPEVEAGPVVAGPPEKWRKTKAVGRVAGQAAPYVQAAALIGWLATGSFDDGYDGGDGSGDG